MKAVEIVLDDTKKTLALRETTSKSSGQKMFRASGFLEFESDNYNVNVYVTKLKNQRKE